MITGAQNTQATYGFLVYLFHVTEMELAQWQILLILPLSSQLEDIMISVGQKLPE